MQERKILKVSPARVLSLFNRETGSILGDIPKTYSADWIAEKGRVRGYFEFGGKNYVCVGGMFGKGKTCCCDCAELITRELFQDQPTSYSEKQNEPGAFFYYGIEVKCKGQGFVLGQSFRFVADESQTIREPEEQLTFEF